MTLNLDSEQSELIADALMAHIATLLRKLEQPKVRGITMLKRERVVAIGLLQTIRENGEFKWPK